MRTTIITLLLMLITCEISHGEDQKATKTERSPNVIEVPAQGDFKNVDTAPTKELIKQLTSSDPKAKAQAIDQIKASPEKVAPPALYAMSNEMFRQGNKDDALFWFYLGQLRARSDANKSNDVSARQAVAVLNQQYGPLINQYAFRNNKTNYKQNLSEIKALAAKVAEWDRKHPRAYDPRWIALHGMGAFLDKKVAFEPEDKWEAINEETRTAYLKDLDESAALLREIDTNDDGAITEEETNAYKQKYFAKIKAEMEKSSAERKNRQEQTKDTAKKQD